MESGSSQNPEDPGPPGEPTPDPEPVPPATGHPLYPKGGYTPLGSSEESNYPRYQPNAEGPIPPGPPTIQFAAIRQAWDLIQQDFGIYAIASLFLVVLSVLSFYAIQIPLEGRLPVAYKSIWLPYDFSNPAFWGWGLIQFVASRLVSFYLGAGYFSLCIKRLRGEKISVWQVFGGFKPFFGMLAAGILVLTLEAGGCLMLLVPGMFAVGVLAFVPQVMMDQGAGPAEAIRMSFYALRRDWAPMWLLAFFMTVIAFSGVLACGAGVVFTTPLYYFVLAIHYHAYFPAQGGPLSVPITNAAPQLA